jgi:hypothetical protein
MPELRTLRACTYSGVIATANVMMANGFSMMRLRGSLAITAGKEVMSKLLQLTIVVGGNQSCRVFLLVTVRFLGFSCLD